MLQPLQIRDVAARYSPEIDELREFFSKSGLALDTAETLRLVTARLQDDRAFRRDLISHLWVISHADERPVRHADLLAMLAVAAAGLRFAADAADVPAHDLLRFVMQARSSFDAAPATISAPVVTSTPRPPAPIHDLAPASFLRGVSPQPEEALSFEMPQEADDHRRVLWIGGAAAACALLAFVLGLWLHRPAPASPTAPIASAAAPSAETPAPLVLANSAAAQPTQRSEARTPAAQRASRLAPYSPLPESARDLPEASSSVRRKPSPAVPMASPRPAMTAARPTPAGPTPARATLARSAPTGSTPTPSSRASRASSASRPAAVASNGSSFVPKAVPVDELGLQGGMVSAGTTRQAIVRPTSLGIMAANVTYSPAPAYPPAASAARVQGEVKLEAEVGRDGTVASTRIISGPPLLADAAADAVQHWRYRPYLYEGKPVAMNAQIVMDFQLP